MRIHTNASGALIYSAARNAGAWVEVSPHSSRTHSQAYEVKLTGSSNRRPGFGRGDADDYAATWDQWGAVMGAIFSADPDTRMGGSVKRPVYANADDFNFQTDGRFSNPEGYLPVDAHGDHKWTVGQPYVQACSKCSAIKRWEPVQY